jgi:ADP-heptose:LPS heptosyltransferase
MKTSMKICVVQLTRIGDIIQTYQAAKQLKTENPNIELTLIARKKFSQGLEFLLKDVFTNVIELNTQDFFKSNKDDLHKVHTRLHNFIHDIKKFDFEYFS